MSRVAFNQLIEQDGTLLTMGLPPGATFQANAVETPQMRPFIVIRWDEKVRAFADRGTYTVTVWVHDEPGDYGRIDKMLERIKFVLGNAMHVPGSDDRILTCVDWSGDSADLYDDGWDTITKNAGFLVVSRPG